MIEQLSVRPARTVRRATSRLELNGRIHTPLKREGTRTKYLDRPTGLFIKVSRHATYYNTYRDEGLQELKFWDALPEHLRHRFAPTLAAGSAICPSPETGENRYVGWSAHPVISLTGEHPTGEQWREITTWVHAYFNPDDWAPRQVGIRSDTGDWIVLDYGGWEILPEPRHPSTAENYARQRPSWDFV